MEASLDLTALFILVPIVGLFVCGVVITLRSGIAGLSGYAGAERLLVNLSGLFIRIIGYGVWLIAIQRLIGAPFFGR